jgi:hypothetical protein
MWSRVVLNKDQLASIGAVATECTYLDQTVETLIWAFSGMEYEQGKFFTSTMQLDRKLDLLSDLGKLKLPAEKLEQFTKIISDCKLANNDRNVVIHGVWASDIQGLASLIAEEHEKTASAIKRRLKKEALVFSSSNIEAVEERLSYATRQLYKFFHENNELLPQTWTKTPQ